MLGETVFMLCMFGYFLCVTAAYSEDMHGPAKDPNAEAAPADAASNKTKGSAKSNKSQAKPASNSGEQAPAGDAPAEE